jgi:hypothetical protein
VGPVVVNVGSRVQASGGSVVGASAHPEWLALNIARFDLTLNGSAAFHGAVQAPAGTVTVNGGTLAGSVAADRVTLNGNGTIRYVPPPPPPSPPDTTPPVLNVRFPADGLRSNSVSVVVSGTVTDASPVRIEGDGPPLGGDTFMAASLPEGERSDRGDRRRR